MRIRNTAEGSERLEHAFIVGGNVKWFDYTGKRCDSSLKTEHNLQHTSSSLGQFFPEMKTYFDIEMCILLFIETSSVMA